MFTVCCGTLDRSEIDMNGPENSGCCIFSAVEEGED